MPRLANGPRAHAAAVRRDHPHVLAIDLTGRRWGHPDALLLYRWVARRNYLLRTIATAPRPTGA